MLLPLLQSLNTFLALQRRLLSNDWRSGSCSSCSAMPSAAVVSRVGFTLYFFSNWKFSNIYFLERYSFLCRRVIMDVFLKVNFLNHSILLLLFQQYNWSQSSQCWCCVSPDVRVPNSFWVQISPLSRSILNPYHSQSTFKIQFTTTIWIG